MAKRKADDMDVDDMDVVADAANPDADGAEPDADGAEDDKPWPVKSRCTQYLCYACREIKAYHHFRYRKVLLNRSSDGGWQTWGYLCRPCYPGFVTTSVPFASVPNLIPTIGDLQET